MTIEWQTQREDQVQVGEKLRSPGGTTPGKKKKIENDGLPPMGDFTEGLPWV